MNDLPQTHSDFFPQTVFKSSNRRMSANALVVKLPKRLQMSSVPIFKVCSAPVFEGSDSWICLMSSIGDSVRKVSRGGVASIPCEIRRLLRIRNCRRGNTDPYIEL